MARALDIRVFEHVPFEGIGSMAAWAAQRGHRVGHTRFHAGDAPPAPSAYDFLIVMGGPMGVHDEDALPWMREEKRALAAALGAGKSVLGICLGAQLLADVLGAPVTRNRLPEIGWHPVRLAAEAGGTWLAEAFPAAFTAFHWHGDTFAIPAGAVPLGSSDACAAQGFLYGDRALALQFHPEATPESVEALVGACGHELVPGPFVQDADAIRRGLKDAPAANAMLARALDRLERACLG
jgi:GMP synthase (glutamine-hydrolysing)